MSYKNPNLAMMKPEIFLNITFGLDFMSDAEASKELKNHFLTQECTYPDAELMHHYIQEYADHSRDYLNRLFALQARNLEYNPIENYDRKEEWMEDSEGHITKNKSDGRTDSYEYPMDGQTDSEGKRPVSTNISTNNNTSDNNGKLAHEGRIHGNIGVTTGAQMLQGEIDLAKVLWNLKEEFCKQYDDLFMLSI